MNLVELKHQVLELSRADQLSLNAFLSEVTNPISPELDAQMLEIIATRLADLRSGKTKGIPLEEVLKEVVNVH